MYKISLRLFLVIALTLIFIFSLTSCLLTDRNSEAENEENNREEDLTPELDTALYLPITQNSEAKITVVSSYAKSQEYAAAYNSLMQKFKDAGINFKTAYTVSDDPDLPQILIGDKIGATGDCYVDPHDLGEDGYVIRVIGNKIIVAGGNAESLATAIDIFRRDVLELDDSNTDIGNVAVLRSTNIFIRQYYPITSVTVGNNDLYGYDIVTDIFDEDLKYCADRLHTVLYDNAGYWLNVKSDSQSPSIYINKVPYAGDDGFRVYAHGKDLMIECAYPALLTDTFDVFISEFFASLDEREINFGVDMYTIHISTLKYSDFGAVGDGVTDDFDAIKEAHIKANGTGQTVVADKGAVYYLGQHTSSISIKTNTVWSGATFIIDDREIAPTNSAKNYNVFSIEPSRKSYSVADIKSLSKGQTNVGRSFDGPTLLSIMYDGNKQYIRYGANQDNGASQQEIILVDKDGNVDPSTPIMWDYPSLTAVIAYSVDDAPITIKGGSFITRANAAPREYTYYKRGIGINRSNVTIDGIVHTITDEGDTGAPYNGFLAITYCNNLLVQNATLTGHKVYKLSSDANNSMGTYDISIGSSNSVTFKNCSQTNSITDTKYWGIMGSNYCKNLTYDGCVFSRFDAHKGTHNATILNSEIGHQKFSVIGSGTLRVENTVIHGNSIVALRSDYGSTWDGDVILKDITLINTGTPTLISGSWVNHYFGYTCHLPANIIIDGIKLDKGNSFYILPNYNSEVASGMILGETNKNKLVLTESITIRNNVNGYTYYVSKNSTLYSGVEVTEE